MSILYSTFTLRRLRLFSGLILFGYLTAHLLNHALGTISLSVAEEGLRIEMAFWRIPLVTAVLYGAVAVHFMLALWTLYSRHDWRLPWLELLRFAAGFTFPLLLINHAVTTRLGDALFGIHPTYALIVANLVTTGRQGMQLALLAPGWLHGCLGLWITLRKFRAMRKIKPLLVGFVVIIPLLAAAGFLHMTSEVSALGPAPPASPEVLHYRAALGIWYSNLITLYLGAILAAFSLGRLRYFLRRSILTLNPGHGGITLALKPKRPPS